MAKRKSEIRTPKYRGGLQIKNDVVEHYIKRKHASKNPKIKNLLASNFVIYTPYKQEPI